jgi:hypothetical protein
MESAAEGKFQWLCHVDEVLMQDAKGVRWIDIIVGLVRLAGDRECRMMCS